MGLLAVLGQLTGRNCSERIDLHNTRGIIETQRTPGWNQFSVRHGVTPIYIDCIEM